MKFLPVSRFSVDFLQMVHRVIYGGIGDTSENFFVLFFYQVEDYLKTFQKMYTLVGQIWIFHIDMSNDRANGHRFAVPSKYADTKRPQHNRLSWAQN